MKKFNLDKYIYLLGFTNTYQFLGKFILPVIVVSFVLFFILNLFVPVHFFLHYIVFAISLSFVFIYPMMIHEKKRLDIEENLHLFITYAGTISTMKIGRAMLFKRMSQKKVFGEISEISNKIYYLAKKWNMGFAKTCRKIGKLSPSKLFSDFLDRMALVMDLGKDLDIFLLEEQDSLMEDFATNYKKSLENIRLIQNVFVSITVSMSFLMAVALLIPLILGTPMEIIIQFAFLAIVVIDALIFVLIKAFIPGDRIPHSYERKSTGMKKVKRIFLIILPVSLTLTVFMVYLNRFAPLVNLAIGITPLAIVGFIANREEDYIMRRDKIYPTFVRLLGSAIEVRNGAVISSLFSMRVHDFGILNEYVVDIYRRLRIGSDKIKSWVYFASDTGSNLIMNFNKIFYESIYLGGNAEKIGEIVSNNFMKLLSLRKLRLQMSSGLKGATYGSLVGFTASVFISIEIADSLSSLFKQPFTQIEGSSFAANLGSILPQMQSIDLGKAGFFLSLMIVIHASCSAYVLKMVDGGFKLSCLLDLVLMIWLAAIVSVAIPNMMGEMLVGLGLNSTTPMV
ncbi:hypothetical protein GF327_03600 [Candidatus Woesearchaeota archaeon]|nr:hypothetical protein [Candidatus Woesearchaeota archaeon]